MEPFDPLDYTKGIPERLKAFDRLLRKYPRDRKQLVMIQAGPESREQIPRYKALSEEIAGLTDKINERHGSAD